MKSVSYLARVMVLSMIAAGCADNRLRPEAESFFRFGLLEGSTLETLKVRYETREIPMAVDTPLPYYGFMFDPPGDVEFQLQTVMFPPGPPADIKGNLVGDPNDYAKGIPSRKNVFFDRAMIGYKFNEGDPIGKYRIVVFVNDTELTSVTYEIK